MNRFWPKSADRVFLEEALAAGRRAGLHSMTVLLETTYTHRVEFSHAAAASAASIHGERANVSVLVAGRRVSRALATRSPDALADAIAGLAANTGAALIEGMQPLTQPGADDHATVPIATCSEADVWRAVERLRSELTIAFPSIVVRSGSYEWVSRRRHVAGMDGAREERRDGARLSLVFAHRDGSGAHGLHSYSRWSPRHEPALLDFGDLSTMLQLACARRQPGSRAPSFTGDVILAPRVGCDFVRGIAGVLRPRGVNAARRSLDDMVGQQVCAPCFTLVDDPLDAELPGGAAFDDVGTACVARTLIERGILRHLKNAPEATAPAAQWSTLAVGAGHDSLDSMIAKTRRGILLAGLRGEPLQGALDFRGMAQNSFYVEDGKILHPIGRSMVSGNAWSLFEQLRGVGTVLANFGDARIPYLHAQGVHVHAIA